MANSTVASTQTPTAAKQPAVAPPSLTLQIPITPASSSGSNSARQTSYSASAQSLPRSGVLRSTVQPINRHTYPRTLTIKPHHSRFAGQGNQVKGHTARATHTNSRTWIRGDRTEREKWIQIEKDMKTMRFLPTSSYYKFSPFVPRTFEEYLGHRASVGFENARKAAFQVEQKELEKMRKSRGQPKVESIFESRKFADGMSAVLCLDTIWSPGYAPTAARPQAPWPGHDEMDEEGNQRAMSNHGDPGKGYGRFLPLPRVPANDTVVWKQRALLMPTDFDEVRRLSDCVERGQQGDAMKELYHATVRREVEETKIAWADRESTQFWEEKMEEALKAGLSVDLAMDKANIETTANAKEIAIAKILQEEQTKFDTEMLEVFPQSFVNILNHSEENELEGKEKNKNKVNKENKENKSNEKDSKNEG